MEIKSLLEWECRESDIVGGGCREGDIVGTWDVHETSDDVASLLITKLGQTSGSKGLMYSVKRGIGRRGAGAGGEWERKR